MANKKHLQILQRTVATAPEQSLTCVKWQKWYEKTEWFQWRESHPRIKPNLSGADLTGMTLIAINLSFTNLSGANLSGTSLSNLEGADLTDANLSGADLIEAVLDDADLTGANLTGANLENAFLHGTNLTDANFSNACLMDAELWGAALDGANFFGANLFEAEFSDDIGPEQMTAMNAPRSIESSPLQIVEVAVGPKAGYLGLTMCPGMTDAGSRWMRDIGSDLEVIHDWGASTVVTLLEDHELRLLAVDAMESEVHYSGMKWLHLPIRDGAVPDKGFEDIWKTASKELHRRLDAGERILIHCRGGLSCTGMGRTGMVACLILVEHGIQPREAIRRIRAVRPQDIETRAQKAYVMNAVSRGDDHRIA